MTDDETSHSMEEDGEERISRFRQFDSTANRKPTLGKTVIYSKIIRLLLWGLQSCRFRSIIGLEFVLFQAKK
jgi:hypothetical protein